MPKIPERLKGSNWQLKQDWPEDCMVQWGETGMVFDSGSLDNAFSQEDSTNLLSELTKGFLYMTAFFEAFPREPLNTFIRGEGDGLDEAEQDCWEKYERQMGCHGHEYERGKYRGGQGKCKHCNHFKSDAFEPMDNCRVCGKPTHYSQDVNEEWVCKECEDKLPEEEWGKNKRLLEDLKRRMETDDG